MQLGQNIRKLRELKNIKQEYIASRLNISLTSYGKIERNEVDIHFARLSEICRILGISEIVLISFDEQRLLEDKVMPLTHDSTYYLLISHLRDTISTLKEENGKLLGVIEKLVK